MAEHAKTYYQQALSALEGGDPARAMDLLRRAKIMAGDDPRLMAGILTNMVRIAPEVGCLGEAVIWDRQLGQLQAALAPPARGSAAGALTATAAPKRWVRKWTRMIAGVSALAAVIVAGVFLWHWTEDRYGTVDRSPSGGFGTQTAKKRPSHWSDNVGLVLWVQRYKESGTHDDAMSWEAVISSGSAFAVSESGIMLTNKHVTSIDFSKIPEQFDLTSLLGTTSGSLSRAGGPALMVCLGSDAREQYRAQLLYESKLYDFAVLKVDREFDDPLELSFGDVRLGSRVVTCGFPGVVIGMSALGNQASVATRMKDALLRTKTVTFSDYFPADVFRPVVTDGIISTVDRAMNGPLYHMIDATISPGNSGGPLLSEANEEVIGIITLGATGADEYNFALALPQLRSELEPYLP